MQTFKCPQIFLWCAQCTWCGTYRQFLTILSQTSVPEVQTDATHMLCHVKLIPQVFVHVQERLCLWCVWKRLEKVWSQTFKVLACSPTFHNTVTTLRLDRPDCFSLSLTFRGKRRELGRDGRGGWIICKWPPEEHLNFMGLEFSSSNLNNQMWERKRKKKKSPPCLLHYISNAVIPSPNQQYHLLSH